jgi:hypothetical protein
MMIARSDRGATGAISILALLLASLALLPGRAAAADGQSDAGTSDAPVGEERARREDPEPLRDRLAWRSGVLGQGMLGSGQQRPLLYLSTGLRYKTDIVYFQLELPLLVGAVDAAQFLFQRDVFDSPSAFGLFTVLNSPYQYAYIEPLHLRVGRTFTLYPFAENDDRGAPMRLSAGVAGIAELVIFDLPRFNGDIEDFDFENPELNDPVVIGPGAFFAIGGDIPLSEYDVALVVARDLVDFEGYTGTSGGWIFSLDVDYHVDITRLFGAFMRARVSTYTHVTDPVILTTSFSLGVAARLF